MSQPIYDDFFNDPRADTILKSASGKQYRISSWVLSKQSSFFEGVQDIKLLSTSDPIEVGVHDDLLRAMLRSANFDEPITKAFDAVQLRLSVIVSLIDFFRRFEFDKATMVLERELTRRADIDPWALLLESSHCADLGIAVLAVEKLHANRLSTVNFWTNIVKLRPEWQSPFLFAIFDIQARPDPILLTPRNNVPFMRWNCRYQSTELARRFGTNVSTLMGAKADNQRGG